MALLARLKPYNEKKGQLARTYMIDGARFFVDRGWYEVTEALAEKLRGLHQDHYDPDSPALFDVGTTEEADEMDKREAKQVELRATAANPAVLPGRRRQMLSNQGEPNAGGDTTTADVRSTRKGTTSARTPANNQGEPGAGGDTTTADVRPSTLLDPDPEGKDLLETEEERALEIGRVGDSGGSSGVANPSGAGSGLGSSFGESSPHGSTAPKSRTKR